jgi:hypothetical protein
MQRKINKINKLYPLHQSKTINQSIEKEEDEDDDEETYRP